jgi:DNA-binding response OmpR family regulator
MSKGQILIIDDNPKNIQVAASILKQAGYDVEFALDGLSGMAWLESSPFDVILLDVMMPGEDGFEICRKIKSNPRFELIPVIFVTAKTDRASVVQGFESGGEDYITKPYDSKELIVRVQNQIELKTGRELLEKLNKNLEVLVLEKTLKLSKAYEELEATNTQLNKTNEELKQLEKSKQHFLDILGSEVSGSLNEVTGMLQVIKYKVDSKKVAQLIDRIDHSMSQIEIFVNAALRITKLQSSGSILKPERIDAGKLIGFAMFQLDEKIRRKQVNINNQTVNSSVYITGESQLLKAAIIIIIDFFLERNLLDATLDIDINSKAGGVSIIFRDDGVYVTEEDINSYYNVFFPGTMSLSFARMIAEAHLGRLSIANQDNTKGIIIEFELYVE